MKYCFKQTKLPPRFVGDDVKLLVLISNRVDVDDPDIKHFIDLFASEYRSVKYITGYDEKLMLRDFGLLSTYFRYDTLNIAD